MDLNTLELNWNSPTVTSDNEDYYIDGNTNTNANNSNNNNIYYDDTNWELNIENLLIENYLEWTTSTNNNLTSNRSIIETETGKSTVTTNNNNCIIDQDIIQHPFLLPDKTLFCNDSCNSFLKESSDNLNSKLITLTPTNAIDAIHSNFSTSVSSSSAISASSSSSSSVSSASDSLMNTMLNEDQLIEKMFTCNFGDCRKIYAKAAHLKAHLRRHIGDKPYVCTWPNCTWKFSRSDELSRHRRSHSGIKPYKCDYCTKCFSRSDHLTKHRKVHERKMAALKLKAIWTALPQGKPGRRPNKIRNACLNV